MQKTSRQTFQARVAYVLRKSSGSTQKINPIVDEMDKNMTPNVIEKVENYLTTSVPDQSSNHTSETYPTSMVGTSSNFDAIKKLTVKSQRVAASTSKSSLIMHLKQWWTDSTASKRRFIITSLVFTLLMIICVISIIPPVLVLVVFKTEVIQSSFTNYTASVCPTRSTCIGQETPHLTSMTTALYNFDGHVNDIIGIAPGVVIGNNPTPYAFASYAGIQALLINDPTPAQQYIQIPYVNLTNRSFTIEVWLHLLTSSLSTDFGIFGQCDSNGICFSLSLRNGRFVLSFDSMNSSNKTLIGSTISQNGYWVHLAVVYDVILYQQRIYVNGRLDVVSRGLVLPFRGASSGTIATIGRTVSAAYGTTYFQGRMDQFTISAGSARTLCQIYNDATLIAYFPFDSATTFQDYSANGFHGFGIGLASITSGRIEQAIYFGTNTSYFQAECFTSDLSNDPPFSIAFWIKPTSLTRGGSLVHISDSQNGNSSCYDLIALTSSGALVVQVMQTANIVNAFLGPVIPNETWTHVTVLYGRSDGVRIFIDGEVASTSVTTSNLQRWILNNPQYMTLGNVGPLGQTTPIICRIGSIPYTPGPFIGSIDDFRLYKRELTNEEICILANI